MDYRFVKAACFILILLAIHYGVREYYLTTAFSYYEGDPRILVLGDSHPKSINPSILESSANLGMVAENHVQSYYKLKTLVDRGVFSPDVVLLQYDLHYLCSIKMNYIGDRRYYDRFVDYFELFYHTGDVSLIQKGAESIIPYKGSGIALLTDIFKSRKNNNGERQEWVNVLEPEWEGYVENGWGGVYFSPDRRGRKKRIAKANWRLKRHFEGGTPIDDTLITYYKKTLDYCRDNNITVVLVKYPLAKEYMTESRIYIPDRQAYYTEVMSRLGNPEDVIILDYQEIFPTNYYMFAHSDHLSMEGSNEFSKRLNNDVQGILQQTK